LTAEVFGITMGPPGGSLRRQCRPGAEEAAPAKKTRTCESAAPELPAESAAPAVPARRASFTDVRRRALTLLDVVAESHTVGPLHVHRVAAAFAIAWTYWRYILPMISSWGVARWSREVSSGFTQPSVGGPGADVHWAICVLVTLAYLGLVLFGVRFMERRQPVQKRIFEWMFVYNATQALLNLGLAVALLHEVWRLGYRWPWGNALDQSVKGHKLGMLIWLQYHCRQLDLLDTLFMILRKKFQQISFVHVSLRLLNLWGWFWACRFACGGDTYFPAIVNATCQVIVYLYYTIRIVRPHSVPSFQRARVAEMQVLQFMLCTAHAMFCLLYGNVPRPVVAFNLFTCVIGLVFYVDFDGDHTRLGPRSLKHKSKDEGFGQEKVTLCFDSCGWLYCYHFGVAQWIQEHMLPKDLTCAEAETDRYPQGLAFSGSSGGSLVAGALGSGINVSDLFEYVLTQQESCRSNPFRIFTALESAMDKFLPENAGRSLSGRVRMLLTRISSRPPFVTGEIVDQYSDRKEAWHTMRASCHIPGVFLKPYKLNGRYYFDGLLWSSFFVPWASDDSHTIRVSALSRPLTDISAPLSPLWWSMFPPPVDVLRGMYWIGYRDAARWFSAAPTDPLSLCMCRRSAGRESSPNDDDKTQISRLSNRVVKHRAAEKLIINRHASGGLQLPSLDPVTGQPVAELLQCYSSSVERNLRAVGLFVLALVLALVVAALHL